MKLTFNGRLFVLGVSAAGLLAIGQSLAVVLRSGASHDWIVLAGLTLLSGSFTLKIPSLSARISVSDTFVFASVLLFGPAAGTVTAAFDTLVVAWRGRRRSREPLRILFNLAAPSLSIWIAGALFYALTGLPPLSEQPPGPLPFIFGPLVVLTLVYFTLNSGLVAIALAFERATPAFQLWRKNFLWLSVNYFGGASVAALLVSYTRTVDFTAFAIIVPLLVISYLTYKTTLGRVEDATLHVAKVDAMYMATIQTLATAIDAKDQVTHGHIRRVQRFAVGLARKLGLEDEAQLKAVEAAALLHDMGKLAVPEHILNKPGRLTPGEFEKMKLHASVGAEMLSSINFPYPVVPIVRHHHENWDGTGYPDGIKGVDIPLGARILAVVDCFDALTSERPYRRKMSDEEATAILMQRRGVMYDPLVVDRFIEVKDTLAASLSIDEASDERVEAALRRPRERTSFVQKPIESGIAQAVSSETQVVDTISGVLASVCEATGAVASIVFAKDPDIDAITSVAIRHRGAELAASLTMPLGQGVSGWVAANGKAVTNADASLDRPIEVLGIRASRCLAVPVHLKGDTAGVLVAYLDDSRGFSERDVTFLEGTARLIADSALSQILETAVTSRRVKPTSVTTVH